MAGPINRSLLSAVFFGAIRVKIRDEGVVRNKGGYVELSILSMAQRTFRDLDRADQRREFSAARLEFLRERVTAFHDLTAACLTREIRGLGYMWAPIPL